VLSHQSKCHPKQWLDRVESTFNRLKPLIIHILNCSLRCGGNFQVAMADESDEKRDQEGSGPNLHETLMKRSTNSVMQSTMTMVLKSYILLPRKSIGISLMEPLATADAAVKRVQTHSHRDQSFSAVFTSFIHHLRFP